MNVFWRTEPLSPDELELVTAVGDAHSKSAFRQNPSTVAIACVAQGSGDLCRSIAAALMTIGGQHGPIVETYEVLSRPFSYLEYDGEKIPGWGSSFVKGEVDPIWLPVQDLISKVDPTIGLRLDQITQALHESGADVYPNPSAFTASAAIILGIPKRVSPYLLIMGRLSAWAEIFMNETKGAS